MATGNKDLNLCSATNTVLDKNKNGNGKCVHQKFGGATKHEMNSLKEAFKGVCEYRDTLEKQSTKMLKDMYIMAKEHKSIENRRSIVTRQLDELNRLMADVKGDRHATPMKSNR